ncbi:acetyltransferase [Candidatus Planktophila dulcis]|uniref:GNAT family N-acetyltransferase n=1 Tax=Candidatus Planktophila dulcis TaxID=1884914 RepID=UPI000BACA6F3|nr:GNAT family protein [Candidatus Planktophila dulcis]ASY14167.1 acetyltransferase [Candidatus Planktophila dulcis]ASY20855.1 acetyltransferase [Candidatus Planktophila dulcis]
MIWWPTEIPTLQYGLVTLRPSEEKDIDSVFNACQDPLIPAFTTVPAAYTIDHAIDFVRSDPFSFAERREFRFVIDYGNGDDVKFAGVISLHTINIKNHTAEIGYWLEKSMRGKGIGTIAAKMITDYGFKTLGFRRIDGLADVDNTASQKLLTSAGYQKEGILRNKVTRDDGRQIDMALFATTDLTWKPLDN